MNLLFLLKGLDMGGVEVVTAVLGNKFQLEGHQVSIFALDRLSGSALTRFSERLGVSVGVGINSCKENVKRLRKILIDNKIDIVINQWSLPYATIKTITKARKGLDVKLISVYHNDPLQNGRIQGVDMQLIHVTNRAKRCFLLLKRALYRKVTSSCMSYTYYHSDKFMVLSNGFIKNFKDFTGINNSDRLIVQTNPVTIDTSDAMCPRFLDKKRKEILYVGRLDNNQKRVYRIIDTWSLLEDDYPDWKLTIVGDGEERANVEHQVRYLELKRVSFEGFQQPQSYYKRASILVLASEFEGFPLVLAECMSFGVVPVVLDSYAAAKDIVHEGVNGFLVPYNKKVGFDSTNFASKMKTLMTNPVLMNMMAIKAIETSKEYSIDAIYEQWMKVLNSLT